MALSTKRKCKYFIFTFVLLSLLYVFGVFHHPLEKNFYSEFRYPYDGDIEDLVSKLRNNLTPSVSPINNYRFYYYKKCTSKCIDVTDLRVVFLIKSSPQHFERRMAIRSTWGFQRRFSDVEMRTVFFVGIKSEAKLQKSINEESQRYRDIVQANFTDTYFNNTYKTMSALYWVAQYCSNSKFYVIVDDDFYVSVKNILRFIKFPSQYPKYLKEPWANFNFLNNKIGRALKLHLNEVRLYAGYTFESAPHRHLTSKWYVSLKEYPYHMWPPYVSGGAVVCSRETLLDMYFASFYTKHFRFDDIYMGLLAFKVKIEPFHSEEFYFCKKPYNKFNYEYVIASHGYDNPKELIKVWSEQKILGNA
ncbi:beta-1,3-galactosyltransferase brn [Cylas formicarius]|uniref:beta-1,3-galactosyltransferase brn n=1 Tax=Cylas formicarius TaxID=197179 RepID=UPI002958D2A3|nr:beta-1,3-galactosyltransferase brn [Cylas formicarius]